VTGPKFQLERVHGAPVSSEEILADMRRAAGLAGTTVLSQKRYSEFGKYDPTTASRRFGTWNKAVVAAGLEIANELNISHERLSRTLCACGSIMGGSRGKPNSVDRRPSLPMVLTGGVSVLGCTPCPSLWTTQILKNSGLQISSKPRPVAKLRAIRR